MNKKQENMEGAGNAVSGSMKPSRSKKLLPLVLAFLTLLLTSCGWQGVGSVIGKGKNDGYWYTSSYCAAYDAKGNCTMNMQQMNYAPDVYYVKVKDDSGETHDVEVNQSYWEASKEGDHFDNRDKN